MEADAICAEPPDGLELVATDGPIDYPSARDALTRGKNITASCPAGKHLLGSGGKMTATPIDGGSASGKVGMVAVAPINPLTEQPP